MAEQNFFLDSLGLTHLVEKLKTKFSTKAHTHSSMTGASDTAAGAAGMVPAPKAGNQTAFLRGDGTWGVPDSDVFVAIYGETTMDEIGAAEAAGKLLACDYGGIILPVVSGIAGIFYNFYGGTDEDGYMAKIQSDGTWSYEEYGGYTPKAHTHKTSDITDLSVPKSARFVVGTSTNGWTEADCDYLCDGTSDQEEINEAIASLSSAGGEIVLLDGTYNLDATITLNVNNTTLRGSGAKLVRAFEGTSSNNALIVISAENCTIRDLSLDGVKGTYSSTSYNYGIYIKGNNNTVENCFIENNGHCGIITASGEGHIVKGNHSLNNGTYGIYLSSDHGTAIGNTCNSNKRGITTWGDCNVITGNICRQNSEANIHLYSSLQNIVTGNNCRVISGDTTIPTYAIRIQDSSSTGNIVVYNQVGEGSITSLYGGNIVGSPGYTYGTTDLTAGSSELETGQLYLVYE